MVLTAEKRQRLEKVSHKGIISALAFDQRGALKRLMMAFQEQEATKEQMEELKCLVSKVLTPQASSILLDPEYGLPAIKEKDEAAGLLLAYEKTGYDANTTARMPDCLEDWSVKRLKEAGADAIKFLLYYDVDGNHEVNQRKQAYIERIGSECQAEDLPFFLEILAYDETLSTNDNKAYAKVRPHKVNAAMSIFSQERFGVDVLKVEVPVDMQFVEGFANGEVLYTQEEASAYFREQEASTSLPYIYLSGGVSATLFQETLSFAARAGARFSGVLCGRATWAGSVKPYVSEDRQAACLWLEQEGLANIQQLNSVLEQTAVPWYDKLR